nr:MAG TPA: hypothetical protein [Caudoviricetes sp.]
MVGILNIRYKMIRSFRPGHFLCNMLRIGY